MRPEDLFDGHPQTLKISQAIAEAVSSLGEHTTNVTKSQVAFRRRRGFAFVWRPGQYVTSAVPAVLSIALPHEVVSARFKEVVHANKGVWMHHLEVGDVTEIDGEVLGWIAEAYASAG